MKYQFITILITSIFIYGCVPENTVWEQYHSKMKHIEPGFHLVSSNNDIYRLRYIGGPDDTAESAKSIWLERAKKYCENPQTETIDQKIVEKTKIEYHGNTPYQEGVADGVCGVVGFVGCLLVEILSTEYIVEKKTKYPEIEGTIDCSPGSIESNNSFQSTASAAG